MDIKIIEVNNKKLLKKFIDFPHDLYSEDVHYAPELFLSQKEMFNEKKYPFYEFGSVKNYLATSGTKVLGRISAIHNPRYNEVHNSKSGFFGFFDCINDQNVANKLMSKAVHFAKENGHKQIIGPTNFSTNETAGMLVHGFQEPAKVMMTYNFPYYQNLVEDFGFAKEMDLFAYFIKSDEASDRYIALSKKIEERLKNQGISIRLINKSKFKEEISKVKDIYNSAWEHNWGFVPFTDREFDHLAEGLKLLVDPSFAYIAEYEGKAVGFSVSLPDINEITKTFKKGRLFPFNIFKLLFKKSKVKAVRIAAAGVKEEFRKKGIEAIFFAKNIIEARKRKLKGGEASWILENNRMMCAAAENLNGKHYKTYRLYSKTI